MAGNAFKSLFSVVGDFSKNDWYQGHAKDLKNIDDPMVQEKEKVHRKK